MSISLDVYVARTSRLNERHVPIATERAFKQYWRPGCFALGLQWVPDFQTGFDLRRRDIAEIVSELIRLRGWMSASFDPETATELAARIDRLVSVLNDLADDPSMEASIG